MQNNTPTITELHKLSSQISEKIPYLKMLVLFGSRAAGNTKANSDWDFAILCDEEKYKLYVEEYPLASFAITGILGEVFKINSDKIDIVQLNHCSKLIAHFIARDGQVLYEQETDEFDNFRIKKKKSESELKKISQENRRIIEIALTKWGV
ncbi:MAG: nucleotidyltransferase domain-containing protein [Nostocales cyanobacterium]|nr:MAG: nucleotidyltransferase domain-containing protein [Nostocales cyanobacterium]